MATIEEKRKNRKKKTGEDFTPVALVNEILDKFPIEDWKNPELTWLDPTAGNGNFLCEVKHRLMAHHTERFILENMIFGVEKEPDNCEEMIERLYGKGKIERIPRSRVKSAYKVDGLTHCFKHNGNFVPNIVCADGLIYDYSFGRNETPKDTLFDWDSNGN